MMIIITIILLLIVWGLSYKYFKEDDIKFWKKLFSIISLKVVNYYCKGSPTKVVMIALRCLFCMYEIFAISYPTTRVLIKYDKKTNLWELFMEFQWDTISVKTTLYFLIAIVIIVVIYLFTIRYEDTIENWLRKIHNSIKQIQGSIDNVGNKVDNLSSKMDMVLSVQDLPIIKHLLPNIRKNIASLKISTAFELLNTIYSEIEINGNADYSLQASIQYLLGECAIFIKGIDSKLYHIKAYQLMIKSEKKDSNIIEGLVYEYCKAGDFKAAKKYADEILDIDKFNYWCYIPQLMTCYNLSKAYDELPAEVNKLSAIATTIMLGGGRDRSLGIDIKAYSYNNLDEITSSNFSYWILDLSVATTLFCQNFIFKLDIKPMYNTYAKDLHEMLDKYFCLLRKTEIDNLLPDTIFLHAITGYFKDQDNKWLDILKDNTPTNGMKEIYYLGCAIILNDAKRYEDAKKVLKEYSGDSLASILNMRYMLAFQYNDVQECIEIFKHASIHEVIIPDHLSNYFFSTLHILYNDVKDFAATITFENKITEYAHGVFLKFKAKEDVDIQFIKENKNNFHPVVSPYMAMIANEKISLDFAIELLEKYIDRNTLDFRTYLLISYYRMESIYRQKLYNLLKDLRHSNNINLECLYIELQLSDTIGDYYNCLEINKEIIRICPNDDNVWVNQIKFLYLYGGHENEIKDLKIKFLNKILLPDIVYTLFNIYCRINENAFAIELLYQQIIRTNNQELKDFFINIHLNPKNDILISQEKNHIEIDDEVTLEINNNTEKIQVNQGSTYEKLLNKKKDETCTIQINGKNVTIKIISIHNKYHKLLCDIFEEISKSNGSKNITFFSIDDFNFKKNPLQALQQIAGISNNAKEKENALLQQYHKGEMSLLHFVKRQQELISSLYEKIFGDFMVCTFPNEFFNQLIKNACEQKEIVLDLSSLIALHEFDKKYGLSTYSQKFYIPKSIATIVKEQMINEEKGIPTFFSQKVSKQISIEFFDKTKTILWNKLKSIEQWINDHCTIKIVEEIVNLDISPIVDDLSQIEAESWLLAQDGRILLSEDWFNTKKFWRIFPSMSIYNWLSLMNIPHATDWGQHMLECRNVGYPMSADYIRLQYRLNCQSLDNNYQTCLENMMYNPFSYYEVILAAKGLLLDGIVESSKILGITNMLSVLFSNLDYQTCLQILQKEYIESKDCIWHQCLRDALKISHSLILPGGKSNI